jgi:hypothetical protein
MEEAADVAPGIPCCCAARCCPAWPVRR